MPAYSGGSRLGQRVLNKIVELKYVKFTVSLRMSSSHLHSLVFNFNTPWARGLLPLLLVFYD